MLTRGLAYISVPPNVEFFVDNLEEEWTFDTPFDFIYMRFMTGSIKDWPKWLGQVYKYVNSISSTP